MYLLQSYSERGLDLPNVRVGCFRFGSDPSRWILSIHLIRRKHRKLCRLTRLMRMKKTLHRVRALRSRPFLSMKQRINSSVTCVFYGKKWKTLRRRENRARKPQPIRLLHLRPFGVAFSRLGDADCGRAGQSVWSAFSDITVADRHFQVEPVVWYMKNFLLFLADVVNRILDLVFLD